MEQGDGDFEGSEQHMLRQLAERDGGRTITDKEFYKAMQKLKDRGQNAVPPKKSASAYIIFGKEVSTLNDHYIQILETRRNS